MIQDTDSVMAFQRVVQPDEYYAAVIVACVILSFLILPMILLVGYLFLGSRPTYFVFLDKGKGAKTIIMSNDSKIATYL